MAAMSMDVCWSAYGRPAVEALHARVATAKRGDPLRPVTIVVPTNYVGVSVRRLLASGELGATSSAGAGLVGVTLLTVYRLAELLGAPRLAAAGRRPVSTPVLAAAVRRALPTDAGRFAPVAEHPATQAALVGAYRELSDLSEASLTRLAATGQRAAEVVALHRRVRTLLAADWYAEADLMAAATDALQGRAPVLDDVGTLLVHLPQKLSRPAARLVRTLAEHVPVTVIAGRTGVEAADADVERTLARLGAPAGSPPPAVDPPVATAVVSVSDAEEEVREAVRRIMTALRDGVALERMALLYPSAQPYARLAHEQLAAAGITYNGAAVRPLADRLVGRWLLDLLALADRGYRRRDVADLLAAAPVRRGGQRVPVARWERISREAGVARGRSDWDERLRRFALSRRAQATAEEGGEDPRTWLVERLSTEAAAAEGLRRFVLDLVDELAAGTEETTWTGLVAWTRRLLGRYLGDEGTRGDWPEIERVAADKVDAALDRLATLDDVEDAPTLATFRRTLELELDSDLARVGRFGQGLLVGGLPAALGVDLDLVIVLGCAEGVLPSRVREDSLLSDDERTVVAEELAPRRERVAVEHRHLLAALAGARGERILFYPRGDLRRSAERPPSRWLLDTAAALQPDAPPARRRRLPADAPWLHISPSFAGALSRVAFPSTRQEYALRALDEHRRAGRRLDEHALVAADRPLTLGVAMLHARRRAAFTRYDGNLSDPDLRDLLPSPAAPGVVSSPTRLEAWARCPHAYLLEHILGVQIVDDPEELLEISPADRGSLVHEALEAWLREQLRTGVPAPGEGWSHPARERLATLARQCCERFRDEGLTGHPLLWGRDRARLLTDLERFVDADDQRRRELGVQPVAAEVAFGMPGGGEPVSVVLPDGRSIRLRGKIDRLDATADGRLVVTDYKTGSPRDVDKLDDDPVRAGTKLQLPVYALAAQAHARGGNAIPTRAEYWFVTSRQGFQRRGYAVDDAVLARFGEVLAVIVAGIEQGLFPARPPEPGWRPFVECRYCDPDGLGTADARRRWERLRRDPALHAYVAQVEPDALAAATQAEAEVRA